MHLYLVYGVIILVFAAFVILCGVMLPAMEIVKSIRDRRSDAVE
ncbi:hypothetical protein BZB76_2562 [Actinomadura pelletieri DSM 43383]|uniref:Uncharacterized protein n=1 Tax=Actinomadura pelletieri DSM 43383 TaxID=1120940 RepID=A0A495QUQ3_9ACTN|nr:hypothetical protein [Actinomadura pelletieri]RKS77185.1 hypothetical protein BZB76_2562 [Actinomadura pelletieri DSM 43383]